MTTFEHLEYVAQIVDGDVRRNYSGRGMYGRTCVGIATDDWVQCIELAAKRGLTGAKVDSMGRSSIVYWPEITSDAS